MKMTMKLKSIDEFRILNESVKTLKLSLPKAIYQINKAFKKSGMQLYVVGGAVRDAILGIKPKDFDLATNARPDKIQAILNEAGIKNYPKGEAFGVISAIVNDEEFEIATFREETYRDSGFLTFIEYINKLKPENYEERLHIFIDMSTKQ